jgi:hypothetical protein
MPHTAQQFETRSYLILMDAGVIACDLTQIVLFYDPQATVTLVQTIAAAVAHLDGSASLTTAILWIGPGAAVGSGLADAIRARGGRLHLIGDDAETADAETRWSVILRPFSTESIIAVLERDRVTAD